MQSKKIVVRVLIFVGGAALWLFLKDDLWETNEDLLKEEVLSIDPSVETITLLDVTPFQWDEAYSFRPYTPKDVIYETIGYKWDIIAEALYDEMGQVVFLKDGKVVCYLYGLPQNNGYSLSFSSGNSTEGGFMLDANDDLNFQVERKDQIIYLKN